MNKYELMHKNIVCGIIELDETTCKVNSYKSINSEHAPFLGTTNPEMIKKWWEMRTVPATRSLIQNLIKRTEIVNAETYLAKNLALSMTDNYWVNPIGSGLTYEKVKLTNLAAIGDGKIPYYNQSLYDPNSSLGGEMEKYWDLTSDTPILIKESTKHYGQQSLNEVFATRLHSIFNANVPFVKYTASIETDHCIKCKCRAFTSENTEFIPAYEVLSRGKQKNDVSPYNAYIEQCVLLGIPAEIIQRFMDYQTMTDFLITNTDRHLGNFGVLRDADSMRIIAPAPIFDSGNSMFYDDSHSQKHTRASILEIKTNAILKSEEKMISKIKDKHIIPVELAPSKEFVVDFFTKGHVPEDKAVVIAHNYGLKVDFIKEIQKGLSVSLYIEKQKERQAKQKNSNTEKQKKEVPSLEVVCGLPFSGKTEKAKEIIDRYTRQGCEQQSPTVLYSFEDYYKNNPFFFDEEATAQTIKKNANYKGSVFYISANDTREEMHSKYNEIDDDIVFAVNEARIKSALAGGASVVYDATNLYEHLRTKLCRLADSCGQVNKTLTITDCELVATKEQLPAETYVALKTQFLSNPPSMKEGWDNIKGAIQKTKNAELDTGEHGIS